MATDHHLHQSIVFFNAFNKVILVLGLIGAEDVGGFMTIHMFGATLDLLLATRWAHRKTWAPKHR